MTFKEFSNNINEKSIPESWYSIDNGVKFNASILINNKSYWEFFDYDEMGEKHNWKILNNEEEALDFLWKQMERKMILFNRNKK